MSEAARLIEDAKRIRQRLRYPPNAVVDRGIDLTRKSTAYKGSEPIPDAPIKKILGVEPPKTYPEVYFPITFEDILNAVATHFGLSAEDLRGISRRHHICYARFVLVYLAIRFLNKKSIASIGRDLNKDHTSILHARNRINGIIAGNPKAYAEISMIEKHIETTYNYRPSISADGQFRLAL